MDTLSPVERHREAWLDSQLVKVASAMARCNSVALSGGGSEKPPLTKKRAPTQPKPVTMRTGTGKKPQRRLTAAKQVERDMKIIAMRSRMISFDQIARTLDTPLRTCKHVWSQHVNDPDRGIALENAAEFVREGVLFFDALVEQLVDVADTARGYGEGGLSNLIGALKSQADIFERKLVFLQAMKMLPEDLGTIRDIEDLRRSIGQIAVILDEENVPIRVLRRIEAEVRS